MLWSNEGAYAAAAPVAVVDAELTCRRAEQESTRRAHSQSKTRRSYRWQINGTPSPGAGVGGASPSSSGADVAALGPEFLFGRISLQKDSTNRLVAPQA